MCSSILDADLEGLLGCNMLDIFTINALWAFELISLQTQSRYALMPTGPWDESLLSQFLWIYTLLKKMVHLWHISCAEEFAGEIFPGKYYR